MKPEEIHATPDFAVRLLQPSNRIVRFFNVRNLRVWVSEWLNSKLGLFSLLLIVFLANYGETWLETSSRSRSPISAVDYNGAYAVQQFEPEFVTFEFHDQTAGWAMYVHSISYFFFFPVIALSVLVALVLRDEVTPFRVCCLALTAHYLLCLPWFLLFPVPERWAYPESNAILLSDQWSSTLILALRPFKALNNSFPSGYVSMTVIIVAISWLFHVRFRKSVTAMGFGTIIAAFALGIDWLAGIMAGILVGILSVAIAWRCSVDLPLPGFRFYRKRLARVDA